MKRIALAFLLATTLSAHAVEYTQVLPDKSAINFVYKQMNLETAVPHLKFVANPSRISI